MINKPKVLSALIILLFGYVSNGQTDSLSTKYLSIGSRTSGICFGNANKYNGIRLNVWDKGLSLGDKETEVTNGANISFLVRSKTANGIQIGGLASHTEKINGISIASISHAAIKINGIAASFVINSDTLNGVFVGVVVAGSEPALNNKVINGIAVGIIGAGAEKVKGATLGLFWCYSKEHFGLSMATYNSTDNLHGLQIGLLNYAGNNPKLLRWMPLINFHP
jgi:hypothetical protein